MQIVNDLGFKLAPSLNKDQSPESRAAAAEPITLSMNTQQMPVQGKAPVPLLPDLQGDPSARDESGRSRYLRGMMIGFEVENKFRNRMNGIVESYRLEAEATKSYAEKNLAGKKAAKATEELAEEEVAEQSAEELEKERKEFEEKIEEKIEKKATGDSEETAVSEEGTDTLPEDMAEQSEQAAEAEADEIQQSTDPVQEEQTTAKQADGTDAQTAATQESHVSQQSFVTAAQESSELGSNSPTAVPAIDIVV